MLLQRRYAYKLEWVCVRERCLVSAVEKLGWFFLDFLGGAGAFSPSPGRPPVDIRHVCALGEAGRAGIASICQSAVATHVQASLPSSLHFIKFPRLRSGSYAPPGRSRVMTTTSRGGKRRREFMASGGRPGERRERRADRSRDGADAGRSVGFCANSREGYLGRVPTPELSDTGYPKRFGV